MRRDRDHGERVFPPDVRRETAASFGPRKAPVLFSRSPTTVCPVGRGEGFGPTVPARDRSAGVRSWRGGRMLGTMHVPSDSVPLLTLTRFRSKTQSFLEPGSSPGLLSPSPYPRGERGHSRHPRGGPRPSS